MRPNKFCECTDELRCGVAVATEGLFIDDLANGIPQCSLETLSFGGLGQFVGSFIYVCSGNEIGALPLYFHRLLYLPFCFILSLSEMETLDV